MGNLMVKCSTWNVIRKCWHFENVFIQKNDFVCTWTGKMCVWKCVCNGSWVMVWAEMGNRSPKNCHGLQMLLLLLYFVLLSICRFCYLGGEHLVCLQEINVYRMWSDSRRKSEILYIFGGGSNNYWIKKKCRKKINIRWKQIENYCSALIICTESLHKITSSEGKSHCVNINYVESKRARCEGTNEGKYTQNRQKPSRERGRRIE